MIDFSAIIAQSKGMLAPRQPPTYYSLDGMANMMLARLSRILGRNSKRFVGFVALVSFATSLPAQNPEATAGNPAGTDKVAVDPDHVEKMKQGTELFKGEVKAILLEHCFACHGGESVQGEFDLATRETLLDSGMVDRAAIDKSSMVRVIQHTSEPHMPQDADKLPDEKIAKIIRWLELGAPYDAPLAERDTPNAKLSSITEKDRNFWSFRPLQPTPVPNVAGDSWSQTPIDAFIVAKLREKQLQPSAPADRRRLIRRAYFNLIGLPPSPEVIECFVNDTDPQAYSKLIDQLLNSEHYGERWARHWMDIARFAESHGYEQDYDRPTAYHYRDFLIRALNNDLPYDQFVQWQVAGDELEPNNPLAMMATGFLGAGAFPTQLTEQEFESARYDELDDMIGTLGTSVLGLSIGCARCHAHKFDPISATDYYRMAANFSTAIRSEVELEIYPEKNQEIRQQYEQELGAAKSALAQYEAKELDNAIKQWLANFDPAGKESLWKLLPIDKLDTSNKRVYQQQSDGSWLATGNRVDRDTLSFISELSPEVAGGAIASLRLETLADSSLPHNGPGEADNGNFAIGAIQVSILDEAGNIVEKLSAVQPRATHQQDQGTLSIAASFDEDGVSGWAVDKGGIGKDQAAVFDLAKPIALQPKQKLKIELVCQHPNPRHIPGRVRWSFTNSAGHPAMVGNVGTDPAILSAVVALKNNFDKSSPHFGVAMPWIAPQLTDYSQIKNRLSELEKRGPAIEKAKVLITSEGYPHLPHHADDRGFPHFYPVTHILARGDVHQKRSVAEPGLLEILKRNGKSEEFWKVEPVVGNGSKSYRRSAVAKWLTDVNDGAGNLAARVIVNRVWQHHFGKGIVATTSDFGLQGEAPTHPELLEWLAVDLVQNGWKLKRLHKLIMLSSVFQQASFADEARASIDREDRFLWRYPPRRLEAEPIRDTMLQVSGLLDPKMYGPGTLDQNMRRRSVYFFVKRSQLVPMMLLFDWPEHLVSIGERPVTTVAPQALVIMNSPQCRQFAEGFAGRIKSLPEDQAVRTAYLIAFGREPTIQEQELTTAFVQRQTEAYLATGANATSARDQALVDFCQTVLSMNELIYVD